jgi:dihydroxy-acid dehydratase
MEARRKGARPSVSDTATRGYDKLFRESVLQAPEGCDFDFLRR